MLPKRLGQSGKEALYELFNAMSFYIRVFSEDDPRTNLGKKREKILLQGKLYFWLQVHVTRSREMHNRSGLAEPLNKAVFFMLCITCITYHILLCLALMAACL